MLDMKVLDATLDQLEQEKKIPREAIFDAIEQALAAAYKKDYGKRGQIIRARFNRETGDAEFYQVKVVVDDSLVKPALTDEQLAQVEAGTLELEEDPEDERVRFNEEHHMYIDNARRIKADVQLEDELVFPLDVKDDFGRVAAQTAKQVIVQRIREAEKGSILEEYEGRADELVSGVVQKVSRGNVFVDLGRAVAVIPSAEKIPGEFYKTGQRIKAYLYEVVDTPRGVHINISRSHPRLIEALFAIESPEIAEGTVEIRDIAREAGSRSKISVVSHDDNIDPIGACVGQRGVRVMTVKGELNGENIDIVPWSDDIAEYVSNALSPAQVLNVTIDEEAHIAHVDVADDQLSLAIGKEGQNVRLAAKLTGWKIDIAGVEGAVTQDEDGMFADMAAADDEEGYQDLKSLKNMVVENDDETTTDEDEG
ncbi:transcription termination/antitermination protein NusA [Candidatus Nomurabacteria bacterium]|nr:transcription termination/antitermination protein NusA [Candidatus Nomurabacteria bacterium]